MSINSILTIKKINQDNIILTSPHSPVKIKAVKNTDDFKRIKPLAPLKTINRQQSLNIHKETLDFKVNNSSEFSLLRKKKNSILSSMSMTEYDENSGVTRYKQTNTQSLLHDMKLTEILPIIDNGI